MSKTVEHEIDPRQTHGFESISGDREYTSELFTKMHNALSLGGYASNDAGHLDVTATGSDKIVTVATGTAFIGGHFLQLKNTHDISLNDAPAGQIRYDLIAVRIDRSSGERKISIIKIEGNATATDSTAAIPWDQLQTDPLLLNSGIFEFPIAAVKTSGTANITVDRIFKTLSSINPLEPMYVVLDDTLGTSAQVGGRILIANEPPANTPHEITLRIRIPENTDNKELALVINDFKGADKLIPLQDDTGTTLTASAESGKIIEIIINSEKTKAVTKKILEVYNVQPLTSQIITRKEILDLTSELSTSSDSWVAFTIHNNKAFFTNLSSSKWMKADIDTDGNFSNFEVLDLTSELSTSDFNWWELTIHNNKAFFVNDKSSDWMKADIDTDGNFSNFEVLNLTSELSTHPTAWRKLTIHNNKAFFISDNSSQWMKADIDTDGNFSNFEVLDLTSELSTSSSYWRKLTIHDNKAFFTNVDSSDWMKADIDADGNLSNFEVMDMTSELTTLLNNWMGLTIHNNKAFFISGNSSKWMQTKQPTIELVETIITKAGAESRYKHRDDVTN